MANEYIVVGSNSYEEAKTFKYLGCVLTSQNSIKELKNCNVLINNIASCALRF